MNNRVDVMVVGAGVAGATAAIGLARQGLAVTLVDRAKLPRHKVCGCCLNSDAVRMLTELGLSSALRRAGATPIEKVTVRCGGRAMSLNSRGGLAVSRYTLDRLLHEAASEAGCAVFDETTARIDRLPASAADPVAIACSGPGIGGRQTITAGVALVADGLAGSCVAGIEQAERLTRPDSLRGYGARLAPDRHTLPAGEVVMSCGEGGYVGTVVLEDGSLDIAAALKPEWVKTCRGPAAAIAALMGEADHASEHLHDLPWRATAPLTGSRRRLWMQRLFFLGDSAGYVEPFTGEGMAWAMRSAQALQSIVPRAAETWDDRLGRAWERAHRQQVQRRQWRCRLFASALRRPGLVSLMLRAAEQAPAALRQRAARSLLPPLFRPNTEPREGLAAT